MGGLIVVDRSARLSVKAGRRLTPWRRLKSDPPGGVAVSAAEAKPVGRAGAAFTACVPSGRGPVARWRPDRAL
jgi:hypothetical protein